MRSNPFVKLIVLPFIAAGAALVLLYAVLFPYPYRAQIRAGACAAGLTLAIIRAESGFAPHAKSSAGAIGLMQLLPSTAEYVRTLYGYPAGDLEDPAYNIRIGTAYLSYLLDRFEDTNTAVMAYNAGEGKVSLWLKDKRYAPDGKKLLSCPYPETNAYAEKVRRNLKIYRFLYGKTLDFSLGMV